MPQHNEQLEPEPYPGLRFYSDTDAMFFAGREQDIQDCAALLVAAKVLILHGRTGCGKSSFLRAGVKPRVSVLGLSLNFSEGFVVIRSTADPLRQLVLCVLEMARDLLKTRTSKFGPLDDFADEEEMRAELKKLGVKDLSGAGLEKAAKTFCEDGPRFVEVITYLVSNMQNAPIFVIDQGEEVFTMARDEAARSLAESETESGILTNLDIGRNDEAVEFFRFLHRFATHGRGSRIVVSLRTEYKGLLDDRIIENGPEGARDHPGPGFTGYYLKNLEKEELEQAIRRPTLETESKEWQDVIKAPGARQQKAPFEEFGFTIEDDVVKELAKALLGDDIPYGGVLPAMQVACLRLWRQAARWQRGSSKKTEVTMVNFRRLGRISEQIEEFLTETVEDVCSIRELRGKVSEATSVWMHTLSREMVKVEADGRAVTRVISREDLVEALEQRLAFRGDRTAAGDDKGVLSPKKRRTLINTMIDTLMEPGKNILKADSNSSGDMITLGHDSLALALRRWSNRNPIDAAAMMMMRMGMGSVLPPDELGRGDLFLAEDPPHEVTILVPHDYVWDGHLPNFAHRQKFAARLGINFKLREAELDALNTDGKGPKNWDEMAERIRKREEKLNVLRRKDNNNRIMVTKDWYTFPGPAPDEGSGAAGKDPREEFANRFSDILVTNIAVGNHLIGPPNPKVEAAVKDLHMAKAQSRRELLEELIQLCLDEIQKEKAVIYVLDQSGRDMLLLAARFINDKKAEAYLRKRENVVMIRSRNYGPSDPLIEKLLEERDTSGDKAPRERYIVGTSFSYAMAIQCGYSPYFGTKNLSELSKYEMERRQTETYKARMEKKPLPDFSKEAVGDITGEMQKVVTHTLWQLGIEPTKWSQGLHRAMVLRLASVGYFTSEYARTHMDKFIAYVQEFVSEVMSMEAQQNSGGANQKGGRLTQRAIKEAIKECFHFLRFEEYGTEVYDLDARLAYWSDHGKLNTKSVAGEIYGELVRLRQATVESFGHTAQAIAWMRVGETYNPSHPRVALAFRLKELAWNHFRIFNFYDAERYMSLAAHLLQEQMESEFREDGKKGVLSSALGED